MRRIDLTGQKFGDWTVISYAGNSRWNCKCCCGKERLVYGSSLKHGDTKSCGCKNQEDLANRRFGKWLVIKKVENSTASESRYLCRCDCGTERVVKAKGLKSGKSGSCGCAKLLDIVGKRFNKLVVMREVEPKLNKNGYKDRQFECQCDCGNVMIANGSSVASGNTKSCGCLSLTRFQNLITKHGMRHTRLYRIWLGMKSRCYIRSVGSYENYGGRGIVVCEEWHDNFQAFCDWAMANGYDENAPKGQCTLDRIDVNGNYEPSNCRWVDMKTQCNNKRNTRYLTYKGETTTIRELSEKYNVYYKTLVSRLKSGKSVEEAIETPVRVLHKKRTSLKNLSHQ